MQKLTEVIYIRIPHDLMKEIRNKADNECRSLTTTVRLIIEEHFTRKLKE